MDVVVPGEEMREKVTALLSPALPEVYITSSAPQLVELAHRDAGKHSGVRFLAEQLGLSPACVAAFGDADNDADMLRYAGVGVAVSNASPACLAAADLVTKLHHEDAVAYAIHELLNIG